MMNIADCMTREVHTTTPDRPIHEAAQIMRDANIGSLPVGENDQLVGMITDRDIAIRAVASGKGPQTLVREVMSRTLKYCYEDDDVMVIARNMGEVQVHRLPVVNRDKRLVGIVALADIARAANDAATSDTVSRISRVS